MGYRSQVKMITSKQEFDELKKSTIIQRMLNYETFDIL